MSTIKEVAAMAGVSVATVSRVINDNPAVSIATRESVLNTIETLRYKPNLLGRNLRQVRTHKILVLIPSISNQFYSKIISAMERSVKPFGYKILVCATHNDSATERDYIEMLTARVVDGIIFLSSSLSAEEMNILASSLPIVQCCEYIEGSLTDTVIIDNERAAYDAVKSLIDCGCRKVAFFGSKIKYTSGRLREMGYLRAINEIGINGAAPLIYLDDYSYQGGQRMAAALLNSNEAVDAVFCISDSIAIGCLREFSDCGIQVPGDISVMGFDDTSIAKVYTPAISTVAQPQEETGRLALELMLGRIANPGRTPATVVLAHKLVHRDTTTQIKYI